MRSPPTIKYNTHPFIEKCASTQVIDFIVETRSPPTSPLPIKLNSTLLLLITFMNLLPLRLVLGFSLTSIVAVAADSPATTHSPQLTSVAYVEDPAHILTGGPEAIATLTTTLQAFEHATGIKMLVRYQLKSPTEAEDAVHGAYMRGRSTQLGTIHSGVLAVYFADEPDWRIWIGDELAPRFVGKPGTAAALTATGEFHDAKEAFWTSTWATADAAWLSKHPATPGAPADAPTARVGVQTTALIEALIQKLTPRS
jgi:hypothetical protein